MAAGHTVGDTLLICRTLLKSPAASLFALCLCSAPLAAARAAQPPHAPVAQRACAAIAAHAGAAEGPPELLGSYVFEDHEQLPAVQTVAFTYDNALAVIALIACDKLPQAVRVGEALRKAAMDDPRLRNGYRAGAVTRQVLPNGWRDRASGQWFEDQYQMGTATGNVAWAGLAMLALDAATGDHRWRAAAIRLGQWIDRNTRNPSPAGGFTGGVDGFDSNPTKIRWESTEHNIDAVALFTWLAAVDPSPEWAAGAATARRFVDSQWNAATGYFLIGTLPSGAENTGASALDVQVWAQLLPQASRAWRRALDYAEAHYRVDQGFAFGSARGGVWLEGTAQAALAYRHLGLDHKAEPLLRTIAREFSADGYVYATNQRELPTSLATGTQNSGPGFYYFRLPHLGATAWAALAASGWNPFVCHAATHKAACGK